MNTVEKMPKASQELYKTGSGILSTRGIDKSVCIIHRHYIHCIFIGMV